MLILPGVLILEFCSALVPRYPATFWLLRLALGLVICPVLVAGSVYVRDIETISRRWWSMGETWAIYATSGILIGLAWRTQAERSRGALPTSAILVLIISCAGASVTAMLSGSLSGGLIGLVLTATVVGTLLASIVLSETASCVPVQSLAIVGLSALLLGERCFGSFPTNAALLLFSLPFLNWLAALPEHRRGLGRVMQALLLAGLVAGTALVQFYKAQSSEGGQEEPRVTVPSIVVTPDDYEQYKP